MAKSQSTKSHNSSAAHKGTQHSSTLNRKYVKRPASARAKNRSAAAASASEAEARAIRAVQKAQIQKRRQAIAEEMNKYPAAKKRGQVSRKTTNKQSQKKQTAAKSTPDIPAQQHPLEAKARQSAKRAAQPTAKQRKDKAIADALRSVATMEQSTGKTISSKNISKKAAKPKRVRSKHTRNVSTGNGKRFLIAFSCAAACVGALAFFIGVNAPDISVRVAAMQTGIEASYPTYVPRDYNLADILSENGKITMNFTGPDATSFILTEEQSSWDTNALLNNYVKPTWKENYTTTHEQGITIYLSNSNAAWVNGNILYTITDDTNTLTKKQIRNIITSL